MTRSEDLPASPLRWRLHHLMLSTSTSVLVWGGNDTSGAFANGAEFVLDARSWRLLPDAPLPSTYAPRGVWTGREMVIFGGTTYDGPSLAGAAYDPGSRTWRTLSPSPIEPRTNHMMVWTGQEVFVWGGEPSYRGPGLESGALYRPKTDTWEEIPPSPISGRAGGAATVVGGSVVALGGWTNSVRPDGDIHRQYHGDGASFDLTTRSWTSTLQAPEGAISQACAIGGDLLVVIGRPAESMPSSGMADVVGWLVDPVRKSWLPLPDPRRERIIDGSPWVTGAFDMTLMPFDQSVLLVNALYISALDQAAWRWDVVSEPDFAVGPVVAVDRGLVAYPVQQEVNLRSYWPTDTAFIDLRA